MIAVVVAAGSALMTVVGGLATVRADRYRDLVLGLEQG